MAIVMQFVLALLKPVADDGAVDDADLASGRALKCVRRDAVEVAESTAARFVKDGDCVDGERGLVCAGLGRAIGEVLGGVVEGRGAEVKPRVDAALERAILSEREAVTEFWQTDEDNGEKRARVPAVVGEDVQMVEDVLVQQVRFIDEEDRVHALAFELLDVMADGVEDGGRGGFRIEAKSEADLPVEVAPSERRVVAVGELEASFGESLAQRAEHARFADTRLAGEQDVTAFVARFDEVNDALLPGSGYPKVVVAEFF